MPISLPWHHPLLPQIVDYIIQHLQKKTSHKHLFIAPSTEAHTQITQAIHHHFNLKGTPTPQFHLYTFFNFLEASSKSSLNRLTPFQSQLYWHQALLELPEHHIQTLFPKGIQSISIHDLSSILQQLQQSHSILTENQLSWSTLQKTTDLNSAQIDTLVEVEKKYHRLLFKTQSISPSLLWLEQTNCPTIPYDSVHLLNLTEASPLLDLWISKLTIPVHTVIYCDPNELHLFDSVGRPNITQWGSASNRSIPLQLEFIHQVPDPLAQIKLANTLCPPTPEQAIHWVNLDPTILPAIQAQFRSQKLTLQSAQNIKSEHAALLSILNLIKNQLFSPTFLNWIQFFKLSQTRQLLNISPEQHHQQLKLADQLLNLWVCKSTHQAQEILSTNPKFHLESQALPLKKSIQLSLEWFESIIQQSKTSSYDQVFNSLLTPFILDTPFKNEGLHLIELSKTLFQDLTKLQHPIADQPNTFWELLLHNYQDSNTSTKLPPSTANLTLSGWLDTLWFNQEKIVLIGMNEEHFRYPDTTRLFLPYSLRKKLDIDTTESRFARDTYLLSALIHSKPNYHPHLILAKRQLNQQFLRPSRLIYQADPENLLKRLHYLFKPEPISSHAMAPTQPSLQFRQHEPVHLTKISPSSIRSYLNCPFLYYLKHHLPSDHLPFASQEIPAHLFGNLIHNVLEQFALSSYSTSTDINQIQKFFRYQIQNTSQLYFGNHPAPFVKIQIDSALKRLLPLAKLEVDSRLQGWTIFKAEWNLDSISYDQAIHFGNVKLTGYIDRIEKNQITGKFRIIDYKTHDRSAQKATPENAHFRSIANQKIKEVYPDWMIYEETPKTTKFWREVQLPLYAAALQKIGYQIESVNYVNLNKTQQLQTLSPWQDFDSTIIEKAIQCAQGVVSQIQQQNFWPPNPLCEHSFLPKELFYSELTQMIQPTT
jgi:ATP-dependent helicase/nuclease subunit B